MKQQSEGQLTQLVRMQAEAKAKELADYWAARGYTVRTWVEPGVFNQADRCTPHFVRSDMINGLPRGFRRADTGMLRVAA